MNPMPMVSVPTLLFQIIYLYQAGTPGAQRLVDPPTRLPVAQLGLQALIGRLVELLRLARGTPGAEPR